MIVCVMIPDNGAMAETEMLAADAGCSVPNLQMIVCPATQVPVEGVAESGTTPAGSASSISTSSTAATSLFRTLIVKVKSCAGTTERDAGVALTVSLGLPTVTVACAVLLAGLTSMTLEVAVNVSVSPPGVVGARTTTA